MKRILFPLGIAIALLSSGSANETFFTPEEDKQGLEETSSIKAELPNVLILGDSISIGYTNAVRKGLQGTANVSRAKANCGDTARGIERIDAWLGDTDWDVIHFNWGLWDLCYRNPEIKGQGNRDKAIGTISTPLPEYKENLEMLVRRMQQTGATLIWASTTFVPVGEAGRFIGDDLNYNSAAEKIMQDHGVVINDLHTLTKNFPEELFVKPGDVHFTREGSQKLADQVVEVISLELARQASQQVIDCHVHLWTLERPAGIYWIKPENHHLLRDFLPKHHEPIVEANGVDGIVLVQAGQSLPDNQWNLDISAHNKTLYRGVVGNLSEVIGTDDFAPLFQQLCEDPRYVGYRLSGRPREELDEAFFRDLELTAKAGKSVDFLTGSYPLQDVEKIAKRVPDLRIIVDHFGGVTLSDEPLSAEWIADFRSLAKQPNVFCKVSALYGRVKEQPAPTQLDFYRPILDLAWECFGEDRLIYGSDWPVTRTTANYASVLELTRSYFLKKGPQACAKLFHENAERFYRVAPVGSATD